MLELSLATELRPSAIHPTRTTERDWAKKLVVRGSDRCAAEPVLCHRYSITKTRRRLNALVVVAVFLSPLQRYGDGGCNNRLPSDAYWSVLEFAHLLDRFKLSRQRTGRCNRTN